MASSRDDVHMQLSGLTQLGTTPSPMERRCFCCDKQLSLEPAIVEDYGLLCFPCRYKSDIYGQERNVIRSKRYQIYNELIRSYEKVLREWEDKESRRHPIIKIFGKYLGLAFTTPPVRPSPPTAPAQNYQGFMSVVNMNTSRLTNLILLFDGNPIADRDTNFVNFKNGCPPDWETRRQCCLERDCCRCRICKREHNLHVHHVVPKVLGGNHSLQNLIAVCEGCHYECHNHLLRHNVQVKRMPQP